MTHLKNYDTIGEKSKKFYQKKWFKITLVFVVFLILVVGAVAWKTGGVLNKISSGNLLGSIIKSIPGVNNDLKGEKDDRLNVALLGMRGENVVGGGLLADTIMVASIKPLEGKVSFISVPRDLQVTVPGTQDLQKINAVHHYGEQKGKGQGLEDMKTILTTVLGIPVDYAVSINFEGFKQMIDAVGGIEITLDQPFEESMQFNEAHVCDSVVFTKPAIDPQTRLQQMEIKYYTRLDGTKYIAKQYPMCTNPNVECGGDFKLSAGKQTLTGQQALCYSRSRVTSSDFERAKRQQVVLKLLREKLLSAGTLTNYDYLNKILKALGDNVRSDMQAWEMKRFFDLYNGMKDYKEYNRVLENSAEGLLYNPTDAPKEYGYILRPIGDNYDRIQDMAKNIFTLPAQSDIKPK